MTIRMFASAADYWDSRRRHYEDCPLSSPACVQWVCDQGHWLAWEIPASAGDRCPLVLHDANSDGRCVGVLSRPECICTGAA